MQGTACQAVMDYECITGTGCRNGAGFHPLYHHLLALLTLCLLPSAPGLPPTQYKAWGSEYREEYRSPETRKATLVELTSTHGTADALRATRYQFQGYPHAFKSYAPSSMTARGQVMPDYESRVRAF